MAVENVGQGEREAARMRAFRLVQEIQGGAPTAAADLQSLAARARGHGWDEVVRAGLFGQAVDAWYRRDPGAAAAVDAFMQRSQADNDVAMLAVALAMRSDPGFLGPGAAAGGEADLARAVVLLEQASGEPLERISAHTGCGIALAWRWLFELADEQYAAALDVGSSQPSGALDFILAPVMFNRAELQLAWASVLHQLGDRQGVAERWRSWRAAGVAAAACTMPPPWQAELAAQGLLLAAIAGEDTAEDARQRLGRLGRLAPPGEAEVRVGSFLRLAAALGDARAGRPGALEAAEQAAQGIDPGIAPQVYDLALWLVAELTAEPGGAAGLRYGRRQLAQRWADRLASLGAMQARIQAERLTQEREVLSRHARLDDLTGVGNRRALEQYLAEAERMGVSSIALILLDLNAFKEVNDRHGHPAGDTVLVRIASILERSVRPSDLALRLGGDEFAVVLAHADVDSACTRAADILAQVDRQVFDDISPGLVVDMSAGVAAGPPAAMTELRARADAALYQAKAGGGQRVVRSRVARAADA